MRNIWLVARREYLEQVRGRAFKMTTFGVPAIFAAVFGIAYLSSLGLGSGKHLAVASSDPLLAGEIKGQIIGDKDAKAIVDVIAPATSADRSTLINQVRSKQIDGFLWVDTPQGQLPTATYTSQSSGDFMTGGRLHEAVNHALLNAKLSSGGMQHDAADKLVDGVHIQTFQVKKDGSVVKSNAAASFYKGYIMAILLSMTTVMYGLNVARSIIQEKTSRIFEVMLAIAKPTDMLAGKLIGVGAVGLTQIGIWLVAGAILIGTPIAATVLSGDYAVHVSATEAILFPVYFVLGYLLYSSLFAWGLARLMRDGAGTADCTCRWRRRLRGSALRSSCWSSTTRTLSGRWRLRSSRPPRPSSCFCACLRRSRRCGNLPSPSAFCLSASGWFCGYPPSSIASAS